MLSSYAFVTWCVGLRCLHQKHEDKCHQATCLTDSSWRTVRTGGSQARGTSYSCLKRGQSYCTDSYSCLERGSLRCPVLPGLPAHVPGWRRAGWAWCGSRAGPQQSGNVMGPLKATALSRWGCQEQMLTLAGMEAVIGPSAIPCLVWVRRGRLWEVGHRIWASFLISTLPVYLTWWSG